jgi:hypothetical protein
MGAGSAGRLLVWRAGVGQLLEAEVSVARYSPP